MRQIIIQAEFDALDTIAKKFIIQSDEIERLHHLLRLRCDELERDGWAGDSASAFFAEMEDVVFPTLYRLENALADAHEVVRQINRIFSSAEDNAVAQFGM